MSRVRYINALISTIIIPNPVGARTNTKGNRLQVTRTNHIIEEILGI
jgi:hypothetical protein